MTISNHLLDCYIFCNNSVYSDLLLIEKFQIWSKFHVSYNAATTVWFACDLLSVSGLSQFNSLLNQYNLLSPDGSSKFGIFSTAIFDSGSVLEKFKHHIVV